MGKKKSVWIIKTAACPALTFVSERTHRIHTRVHLYCLWRTNTKYAESSDHEFRALPGRTNQLFGEGAEVTRKNVCVDMSAYVCFNENVYQKWGPKPRRGFTNTITTLYLKGGDQISNEMAHVERGARGRQLSPWQNEPVARGGARKTENGTGRRGKGERMMTRERK